MWVNNGGNYVTNTEFPAFDAPEAVNPRTIISAWRIDPLINNGYPYIPLMIDVPELHLHPVRQNRYITIYCARTVGGHTVYPSVTEMLYTNGDAILTPVSVENSHDINAMWAIRVVHPIDPEGRWQYIKSGAIVKNMGQLFTVKDISEQWRGNSGQITFTADHVFYQQADKWIYPVLDQTGAHIRLIGFSGQHAIQTINTFTSDEAREGSHHYAFEGTSDLPLFPPEEMWMMPIDSGCTPIEALLGAGGLIEAKGGELFRDNFKYSINERMQGASDYAFDIRIGKNLTGINRVVDISSMVTYFRAYDPWGGWFAIAWDFGAFFGDLYSHYVVRSQNFDFPAEAYSDENWSYDEWWSNVFVPQATAYFEKNGKPIIRYEIDLEDVRQNPDFEIIAGETLRVGDKGRVWDERLGANPLTIEITGTVYDGIREKCRRVIIGDRQSFVSTAMPAVDWGTVPQIVAGERPIYDADGNMIEDADGNLIVQEVLMDG